MPYQGRLPAKYPDTNYRYTLEPGTVTAPTLSFLNDSNNGLWSPATDNIAISTNGLERLRVTNSGNVGVGTSVPANLLHLSQDTAAFRQTSVSESGGYVLTMGLNYSTTDTFNIKVNPTGGAVRTPFTYGTNSNTTIDYASTSSSRSFIVTDGATERLRITSSGNVGIGTTNPSYILEVGAATQGVATINCFGPSADNNWAGGIRFASNNGTTVTSVIQASTTGILFSYGGNQRLIITPAGNVEPNADATQNLGSATKRWANVYSADLQLSNEGSQNDVDGTWGQYTIQEGETDLFLINRRNGKKYKFVLQEVN